MTHTCVSKLDRHWFKYWLIIWSARSCYMDQWWYVIFQCNLNQNKAIIIEENEFLSVFCKRAAILSRLQAYQCLLYLESMVLLLFLVMNIANYADGTRNCKYALQHVSSACIIADKMYAIGDRWVCSGWCLVMEFSRILRWQIFNLFPSYPVVWIGSSRSFTMRSHCQLSSIYSQ